MAPPDITATTEDAGMKTRMLAEDDFFSAVLVTVAVSVYMAEVVSENAGSRYFDGSLEEEATATVIACGGEPIEEAVMFHENCKDWVDVDPSQLAVKAFVATESGTALDWISI